MLLEHFDRLHKKTTNDLKKITSVEQSLEL
jgi:hypothetical protein